jgi:hypothetical protein
MQVLTVTAYAISTDSKSESGIRTLSSVRSGREAVAATRNEREGFFVTSRA